MDYTRFFAKRVARRHENLIRKFTEMRLNSPNSISLAGGMPNPSTFPIKAMSITYSDNVVKKLVGQELNAALQYGPSQGLTPFVQKYREFQQKWHNPPYKKWDVVFMAGSQDGFCKVLDLLLNEGEPIMVQIPTYTATNGAIRPYSPDYIGIRQDADGIIPEEIEKSCESRVQKNQPLPKLLYVNPVGANPTGAVLTYERKKRIYELARKYDFLIMEDDPYYFLHFLDKQPESFLSLDVDGRVIRFDSFSKIFSAGLRLGVVTAPEDIIKKLTIHVENSTLHASSLSQMLVYKLLEGWSDEEFKLHVKDVQKFYGEKRDMMLSSVEKHLTGIAEWSVPKAGMFVWIKIPSIDNTYNLVMEKLVPNGILVVSGNAFNYNNSEPDQYLRFSYSFATSDEVEKALSILAKIIHEEAAKSKKTYK